MLCRLVARRVPFPLLVLYLGVGEDKAVIRTPLHRCVWGFEMLIDEPRKDSKSSAEFKFEQINRCAVTILEKTKITYISLAHNILYPEDKNKLFNKTIKWIRIVLYQMKTGM